jgi:hypothetical protein
MSTDDERDAYVRRLSDALDRRAEQSLDDAPTEATDADGVDDMDAETAAVLAQLRAPSTWSLPPPGLRARILATAAAEKASAPVPTSLPTTAPTPVPTIRPTIVPTPLPDRAPVPLPTEQAAPVVVPFQRRAPRWRRLAISVPVAAAAAVAFTFAVLAVDDAVNAPERGVTYEASGTPLAPEADAEVSVRPSAAGFSVVIDARNLPAAAPGSYYAAFLSGPRGVVPLGSFHGRKSGNPITMWSGVDPKDYPDFTVTLQREGDPPEPSDQVVLEASLS